MTTTTTTNITVRLRPRKRLPLMRAHGLLTPIAAMVNMVMLLMILMWWLFKYVALGIYLGGRKVYRTAEAIQRRHHPAPTFDWTQGK